MPVYTIGAESFDEIIGSLQPRSEELEIFVRPGRDDSSVRRTGTRGRPFSIVTLHYVVSFTSARDALQAYVAMIDGNAVEIVQHDVSFGEFRILDVTEIRSAAVSSVIGSIISNPGVLQLCQWNVQNV